MKRLLNETSLLNFVNNENNNQFDNRILNMYVIIKKIILLCSLRGNRISKIINN